MLFYIIQNIVMTQRTTEENIKEKNNGWFG